MKYIAPRGTVDILPDKIDGWIGLENILRTIAENYNVKEMRTPKNYRYFQVCTFHPQVQQSG